MPVKTDKGYESRTFNNIDDVWNVIGLVIEETKDMNEKTGRGFDLVKSMIAQIPFFTCPNHIRDLKYLKLINQYLYCVETGTPAYPGSYGEQPVRWIEHFFIIKNAIAKKQQSMQDEAKREAKNAK